jgi:hypothetical protein
MGEVLMGGGEVNEGDKGEGTWLMDFIHLLKIEQRNLFVFNSFKWGGEGVQGKRWWG